MGATRSQFFLSCAAPRKRVPALGNVGSPRLLLVLLLLALLTAQTQISLGVLALRNWLLSNIAFQVSLNSVIADNAVGCFKESPCILHRFPNCASLKPLFTKRKSLKLSRDSSSNFRDFSTLASWRSCQTDLFAHSHRVSETSTTKEIP